MKKIGEVAKLAGVSIRTLRYYDEIGLLSPEIMHSKYRLYNDACVERLWHILNYKKLDFSLTEIKDLLDDKSINKDQIVFLQKMRIKNKIDFYKNMLLALENVNMEGFKDKMFSKTNGAMLTSARELLLNREVIKYVSLKKIIFVCIEESDDFEQLNDVIIELTQKGFILVGVYSRNTVKPNIYGLKHFINMKSNSVESLQVVTDYIYQPGERKISKNKFYGIEVNVNDIMTVFKMENIGRDLEFENIEVKLNDEIGKKEFELFAKDLVCNLQCRNLLIETAYLFYYGEDSSCLDDVLWTSTMIKTAVKKDGDIYFSTRMTSENNKNCFSILYTTCDAEGEIEV